MTLAYSRRTICILVLLLLIASVCLTPVSIAGSEWHQSSYDDFKDGYFNYVTMKKQDSTIDLRLGDVPLNWTEVKPKNFPAPSSKVAMAPVWGTSEVVLYNTDKTTWLYNLSTSKWTKHMHGTNPGPIYGYGLAQIYGTDKILLFSGTNSTNYQYTNDTWIYDWSDDNWTWLNISSPPSRTVSGLASIWNTDKAVMFGGYGTGGFIQDTWIFDLSNETWTKMSPAVQPPASYYHEMATIWGTDEVLLFGGYSTKLENTTWVYDLSDDIWIDKKTPGSPDARYLHAMASIHGHKRVVMFGGYKFYTLMNELWIYDLELNSWTQGMPAKSPSQRYMHSMSSFWNVDKAIMFGGFSTGYQTDTWILNLNIDIKYQNGTYTSQAYDTGGSSAFKTMSWYTVVSQNTSIRFQFRTADLETNLHSNPYLGPDGTTQSYYETTGTSIWPGHFGDRWLQYRAYFSSTYRYDTPYLKNVTITYNNLPETAIKNPKTNTIISINNPKFEWVYTDPDSNTQTAFQLIIDNESSFSEIDFDSGEQIKTDKSWQFPDGTAYTALPDGVWYWKVRARDNDGDWGWYSDTGKMIIDTTRPYTSISKPDIDGYYTNVESFSGKAYDDDTGAGLNRVELSLKWNEDNQSWDGQNWVEGPKWFKAMGTKNWFYDASRIEWESNQRYTLRSRAVDNASNTEASGPELDFVIDYTRPQSKILNPAAGGFFTTMDSISGSASDSTGSGLLAVELSIQCIDDELYWTDTGWDSEKFWHTASGTNNWSFDGTTVPWISDKNYMLESRATDNTGNVEYVQSSITFMYDAQPPELSFLIENKTTFMNNPYLKLSISATDTGTGVDRLAFSANGSVWSDWKPYNPQIEYLLSGDDGEKSIYIKVKDRAGNIAGPLSESVMLDTTPPGALSIIVNNDADFTNILSAKLALHAEDVLSGINMMQFSYDGISWSDWEPYRAQKEFPLEQKNGKKTIWFKVSDNAGNIGITSDRIILDTEPPESVFIFINKNAEETDLLEVRLTLRAEDKLTGVSLMSFSTDNYNWSEWEKFQKTDSKLFTLTPGDGEKTIYFRVRDGAGNIAAPVSDTILLNTEIPEQPSDEEPAVITDIEGNTFIYILLPLVIIVFVLVMTAIILIRRRRRKKEEKEAQMRSHAPLAVSKPKHDVLPQGTPAAPQLPAAATGTQIPALPQLPPAQTAQVTAPSAAVPKTPAQTTPTQQTQPEWSILFGSEGPPQEKGENFPCTGCGEPLTKVSDKGGYYCYTCQKYE